MPSEEMSEKLSDLIEDYDESIFDRHEPAGEGWMMFEINKRIKELENRIEVDAKLIARLEADRRNLVALGAYARHAFACNMKSPHREIGDKCDCGYRKAEQALGESLREEIDG